MSKKKFKLKENSHFELIFEIRQFANWKLRKSDGFSLKPHNFALRCPIGTSEYSN